MTYGSVNKILNKFNADYKLSKIDLLTALRHKVIRVIGNHKRSSNCPFESRQLL